MKRKRKKNIIYGTEIFYTKKGLDDFKKKLRIMKVSFSTRKVPSGYQIQWYKKK